MPQFALICVTASMNRVTTIWRQPRNGSSSSKRDGEVAIARAIATIFLCPPIKFIASAVRETLRLPERSRAHGPHAGARSARRCRERAG